MKEIPKDFARSDELVRLRSLFGPEAPFSSLASFVQFSLILDANVILKDLQWLAKKRINPEARTQLLEILESQTINAYCPTFIEIEIKEKTVQFAERYGVDEQVYLQHWERFKSKITFIDVGGPAEIGEGHRDPKDVPYLKLQELLGHPIVSKDKDIEGMGGTVTPWRIVASLTAYSRESATELKIAAMGGISITVPMIALVESVKFLHAALAPVAKKIPSWAWVVGLIVLVLLILMPASREWFQKRLPSFSNSAAELGTKLLGIIEPFYIEYQRSKSSAQEHLAKVYGDGVLTE